MRNPFWAKDINDKYVCWGFGKAKLLLRHIRKYIVKDQRENVQIIDNNQYCEIIRISFLSGLECM